MDVSRHKYLYVLHRVEPGLVLVSPNLYTCPHCRKYVPQSTIFTIIHLWRKGSLSCWFPLRTKWLYFTYLKVSPWLYNKLFPDWNQNMCIYNLIPNSFVNLWERRETLLEGKAEVFDACVAEGFLLDMLYYQNLTQEKLDHVIYFLLHTFNLFSSSVSSYRFLSGLALLLHIFSTHLQTGSLLIRKQEEQTKLFMLFWASGAGKALVCSDGSSGNCWEAANENHIGALHINEYDVKRSNINSFPKIAPNNQPWV